MLDALLGFTLLVLLYTLLRVLGGGEEEPEGPAPRVAAVPGGGLRLLAPAVAAGAATVGLVLALPIGVALAVAILVGIIVHVLVRAHLARRRVAFELELAAALDLVVASLRAGAALVESLATAAFEARGAAGAMLRELCERVRLGEPPTVVLEDLTERHPGEGVRLFAFTLASHFDTGGSAATSMAEVARAIRDRIDVLRRVGSQTVETQASVVGILAITYGLALLMWRQYPDRVQIFAGSEIGSAFIGFSIVLQAVGLLWIASMTRAEV